MCSSDLKRQEPEKTATVKVTVSLFCPYCHTNTRRTLAISVLQIGHPLLKYSVHSHGSWFGVPDVIVACWLGGTVPIWARGLKE